MPAERLLGTCQHVVLLVAAHHQEGVHDPQPPRRGILRRLGPQSPFHLAGGVAEGAAQPLVQREADTVLCRDEINEALAHAGERAGDGADLTTQDHSGVERGEAGEQALGARHMLLDPDEIRVTPAREQLLEG